MAHRSLAVGLVALALILAGCTVGAPGPTTSTTAATPGPAASGPSAEDYTPIVGRVLNAPIATPSTDGRTHLAYELLLSNMLSQDVGLDALTVVGDGAEVLVQRGDELLPWVRVVGAAAGGRTIGPGQQALVFVDVAVAADAVPAQLTHRIAISPAEARPPVFGSPMTEELASVAVDRTPPITIGAPVAGAGWLDGNSCCQVTPHRAAVNPINGEIHVPERFAVDYVRLDARGKVFEGPVDQLSSYAYEGASILAVADGPVVSMGWDLAEQTPGANPTGLRVQDYGGNFIVQDIGGGHYAFYAHLQPGNPQKLAVGQQLTRGQVIATLGNSGNTDAPHLHFHIMDSPLPLASNGLPFVIEAFDLVGTVPGSVVETCAAQSVVCQADSTAAGARTSQSPLYGDVMDYPGL